jgi:flagellar biosynthetic protein FlhB
MDDFAERTVPATERRRRDARARGHVAVSRELSVALILVVTTISLWFLTPHLLNRVALQMRDSVSHPSVTSASISQVTQVLSERIYVAANCVGLILLFIVLAAMAGQLVQTGWLWVPAQVISGFRSRALVSWGSFSAATASVLKLLIVSGVLWRFVFVYGSKLGGIGLGEPADLLVQPARILGELAIELSAALLVLSLADYALQYWRYEQSLKMTVEEQRREQREDESRPDTKRHRKGLHVQLTHEGRPISPV